MGSAFYLLRVLGALRDGGLLRAQRLSVGCETSSLPDGAPSVQMERPPGPGARAPRLVTIAQCWELGGSKFNHVMVLEVFICGQVFGFQAESKLLKTVLWLGLNVKLYTALGELI